MNKIAFIGHKGIPANFKGLSGIEMYVQQLAEQLVSKGAMVRSYGRYWASNARGRKKYNGIEICNLPSINTKSLDAISHSFLATMHCLFSEFDVIWYHGIGPAFFSPILKIFGKKVYVTSHALDWKRKKWGVFGKLFLRLSEYVAIHFSDEFYVVSNSMKKYYIQTYGKEVVVRRFRIKKQKRVKPGVFLKSLGLKSDSYVLFIGRFVPEKRLEWLMRANEINELPVVLAGGSSHSDDYAELLTKMNADGKVKILPYVFGERKAELLSNCKALVLPSSLEGYPVIVAEALSFGKCCLVGDFLKEEYQGERYVSFFRKDDFEDFLLKLKVLAHQ